MEDNTYTTNILTCYCCKQPATEWAPARHLRYDTTTYPCTTLLNPNQCSIDNHWDPPHTICTNCQNHTDTPCQE